MGFSPKIAIVVQVISMTFELLFQFKFESHHPLMLFFFSYDSFCAFEPLPLLLDQRHYNAYSYTDYIIMVSLGLTTLGLIQQ